MEFCYQCHGVKNKPQQTGLDSFNNKMIFLKKVIHTSHKSKHLHQQQKRDRDTNLHGDLG